MREQNQKVIDGLVRNQQELVGLSGSAGPYEETFLVIAVSMIRPIVDMWKLDTFGVTPDADQA